MNNRLQQFIDAEHLTPARLADKLGVQRSNISHILSGRNKPGFDFIEKLLKKFPLLSPDWLLLGKGKMYRDNTNPTLFPINLNENNKEVNTISEKNLDIENKANNQHNNFYNQLQNSKIDKKVEKIIIFYTDNTFDVYTPSKNEE